MLNKYIRKFVNWRNKRIKDRTFILILSVIVGFIAGCCAVIVKNLVHLIKELLVGRIIINDINYLYIIYPLIGILLTIIFVRFILRQYVGDGVPNVLRSISKCNANLKSHNTFSSIITSALTVGFGGSAGLEGPTVITGAAIGSRLGRLFNLNYRQTVQLLVFGAAGAMSAIFKSPVAAVVFVIEVIMFNFTMTSLLPLLLASVTGTLTSYLFLGQATLYPFQIEHGFVLNDTIFYILLGVLAGFISLYATKVLLFFQRLFEREYKWYWKFLIAGSILGVLIFLFPSLYGEGFEATNTTLQGSYNSLFENSIFSNFRNNQIAILILLASVIMLKVVATALTFGAGGIGGIFAPTLFTGAHTGLLFALMYTYFGFDAIPASNFAFMGMAGVIAGVIHAPLTAIFLIAEITGGYGLFVPLMITSAISYGTVRIFTKHSVYTNQLATAHELITHDKDKNILTLLNVKEVIDKDLLTISPNSNLGELTKLISISQRNIFPVVDEENNWLGLIPLDVVREDMFKPEKYNMLVSEYMIQSKEHVSLNDSMEKVMDIFHITGYYNVPVLDEGKYIGFISRSNMFNAYRKMLVDISDEE